MGLRLAEQDVFLNVVGGLTIEEPAADLAAAAAIASSLNDQAVRAELALIGEIGLSGELRWVAQMDARLREAAKLGFKGAVIPHRLKGKFNVPKGFEIMEARSVGQAIKLAQVAK